MKKWLVECHIDNREQFYSREPPSGIFYDATDDFVEAKTEYSLHKDCVKVTTLNRTLSRFFLLLC